MSHLFDRLNFFQKKSLGTFANCHGEVTRESRDWEEVYRNRWRHDKVVRSTHGVNCTGSCSWKIYVKSGIVTWETQQTDYPRTRPDLPNHEPRGCARGASYSWYLYSANRVKTPLVRKRLLQTWRRMRETMSPVKAWAAIQADPSLRNDYIRVRGKGGFVRAGWDEVSEIVAAANAYTSKTWGPDRVIGFSPIPAMSMVSYAADFRAPTLYAAAHILPPAAPEDAAAREGAVARARVLLGELARDPGAFDRLAREHSACPSREAGGRLGQILAGETVPEFEAVLDRIEPGTIAPEPVATRYGIHVVRLDARAEGALLPYDKVARHVRDRLERAAWALAARRLVADLVAAAEITGIEFDRAA